MNDYHPDYDRIIANQSQNPESFRVNPDAPADSLDAKPAWTLKDIYPNIEKYRKIPTSLYTCAIRATGSVSTSARNLSSWPVRSPGE
jgi:hypothetical protein